MTPRAANAGGKPAKRGSVKRPPVAPKRSASRRVFDELSTANDSFAVKLMIEYLADLATIDEKLRLLVLGDLAEWASLKLDGQVVSVLIDDPVKRRREISAEMRHLLAEIHRQRAGVPVEPDDDDPAKKY